MPRVLGVDFDTDFKSTVRSIPAAFALVLAGMLLVDAAFILASADQDYRGVRTSLHVSVDNGIAEHFQFLKWGLLALLLGYLAFVKRAPIYAAWAVLFLYLLVDDSQQIHETYGIKIADALGLKPAFGLRARDFGELAVTAIAAVPLFSLISLTYLFGARTPDRIFTHTMVVLLIWLAFFGVGVDMLDQTVPWPWLALTLNIVEDGGEMIVGTVMVAYAIGAFIRTRQPAAGTTWRDDDLDGARPLSARYSPASLHPPVAERR